LPATLELTLQLGLQVGGVLLNVLSKVRWDIGETLSVDPLKDSIFSTFQTNIEPDLHHVQVVLQFHHSNHEGMNTLLHSFMIAGTGGICALNRLELAAFLSLRTSGNHFIFGSRKIRYIIDGLLLNLSHL